MKKFVFPDTNIFLHFRPLAEFDFVKMLNCEMVELVVAPTVVRELDEKKWSHSGEGMRQRAGISLRRIEEWGEQEEPIRPGVSVLVEMSEPSEDYLVERRLNPRSQDDWLLATALTYSNSYGQENVFLLTADTGPRLRARHVGLLALQPPDKHKLPPARDSLKEENLKLKRELKEYRGRSSELMLCFVDQEETLYLSLQPQLQSPTQEMNDVMYNQIAAVQKDAENYFKTLKEVSAREEPFQAVALQQLLELTKPIPEDIERYKHEVESYEQHYKQYLSRLLKVANRFRLTIKFDLELNNSGTAVAEQVLLTLKLPDKLEWCGKPLAKEMPAPPAPPARPQTRISQAYDFSLPASERLEAFDAASIASQFETFPKEPVFDGNKLRWDLGDCRHNDTLKPDSIYARFKDSAGVSSFQIDYEIHEKNIPKPRKGKLLVKLGEFEG